MILMGRRDLGAVPYVIPLVGVGAVLLMIVGAIALLHKANPVVFAHGVREPVVVQPGGIDRAYADTVSRQWLDLWYHWSSGSLEYRRLLASDYGTEHVRGLLRDRVGEDLSLQQTLGMAQEAQVEDLSVQPVGEGRWRALATLRVTTIYGAFKAVRPYEFASCELLWSEAAPTGNRPPALVLSAVDMRPTQAVQMRNQAIPSRTAGSPIVAEAPSVFRNAVSSTVGAVVFDRSIVGSTSIRLRGEDTP